MSLPRTSCICFSDSAQQIPSLEQHLPAEHPPRRAGNQPENRQSRHGFPAPAFPDDRQRLPRKNRQRDILHGPDLPVLGVESDREVAKFEQRLGHYLALSSFGSSASRSASPIRL